MCVPALATEKRAEKTYAGLILASSSWRLLQLEEFLLPKASLIYLSEVRLHHPNLRRLIFYDITRCALTPHYYIYG
jgi:hypothetical protein